MRLADESPCPFAARVPLVMHVSPVWTVMGGGVGAQGPGLFSHRQRWGRLPVRSANAKEGPGGEPALTPTTEGRDPKS